MTFPRLDAADTRAALPYPALVAALRRGFAEGATVPARHVHAIGDGGTLLIMPAWRAGQRLGVKTVAIVAANARIDLPVLHSTYLLFDALTGAPLAMLDGDEITTRRTAAVAALAASFLARADARRLVVVGAGRVAAQIVPALRAVRPIDQVSVWSRRPESAEQLASHWRGEGIDAIATSDLPAAVARADIVSCATLATAPLVRGAWLQPGCHLDLIGAFTPAMREADAECFARATVFVDTDEALTKAGDVLDAIGAGSFSAATLQATLADLCAGRAEGRRDDMQVTLFKSVGTALADLAAAELAFDASKTAGVVA